MYLGVVAIEPQKTGFPLQSIPLEPLPRLAATAGERRAGSRENATAAEENIVLACTLLLTISARDYG